MSKKKSIKLNKMSWHSDESYYSHISRLWELGDWEALSALALQQLTDPQQHQQAILYKAIGLIQTGSLAEAKPLLTLLSKAAGVQEKANVLNALLASLLTSLGNARALQGDSENAVQYFIEAAYTGLGGELPVQLHRARIRQQIEHLGLPVEPLLSPKKPEHAALTVPDTRHQDLSGDLSLGLWLNLHRWPTDWTVIIGKFLNDTENEFCLRIKNHKTAQFYYGQGDKTAVLNTWNPDAFFTTNQWVHLAVVRKQGKFSRLYVNGVIRAERDIAGMEAANKITADANLLGHTTDKRRLDATIQHPWVTRQALTSQAIRATLQIKSDSLNKAGYHTLPKGALSLAPLDELALSQAAKARKQAAEWICSLDYHELIDALENDHLKVVVVGANDGKNNDPLYEYLATTQRKNTVVLIEPQQQLIPYLQENYRFHPSAHIVNAAIGQKGEMTLYGVKKEYWGKLDVPYAKERGWPEYRAPTGIASGSKEHVANWLRQHLPDVDANDAIEELAVASQGLKSALQSIGIEGPIDVLQIDTEGFDDEVIFNSKLEVTRPSVIFFEVSHMNEQAKEEVTRNLAKYGYEIFHIQENSIALHSIVNGNTETQPD